MTNKQPPSFTEWRRHPNLESLTNTWVEYVLMGFAVAFALFWFAWPYDMAFIGYLTWACVALAFLWLISPVFDFIKQKTYEMKK